MFYLSSISGCVRVGAVGALPSHYYYSVTQYHEFIFCPMGCVISRFNGSDVRF